MSPVILRQGSFGDYCALLICIAWLTIIAYGAWIERIDGRTAGFLSLLTVYHGPRALLYVTNPVFRQLELRPQGLTIPRPWGRLFLPWADIATIRVETEPPFFLLTRVRLLVRFPGPSWLGRNTHFVTLPYTYGCTPEALATVIGTYRARVLSRMTAGVMGTEPGRDGAHTPSTVSATR